MLFLVWDHRCAALCICCLCIRIHNSIRWIQISNRWLDTTALNPGFVTVRFCLVMLENPRLLPNLAWWANQRHNLELSQTLWYFQGCLMVIANNNMLEPMRKQKAESREHKQNLFSPYFSSFLSYSFYFCRDLGICFWSECIWLHGEVYN